MSPLMTIFVILLVNRLSPKSHMKAFFITTSFTTVLACVSQEAQPKSNAYSYYFIRKCSPGKGKKKIKINQSHRKRLYYQTEHQPQSTINSSINSDDLSRNVMNCVPQDYLPIVLRESRENNSLYFISY